ncbi:Phosphatidylserine decarboxylase proenzyme 3 [Sphaceloma murrayae]|uniref:phosphatidylserine decarboxylase n=1 Tax=Sphaceloma murrayae TaxID=2082308 RepID=A0A2K1R2E2_9PEZI|nr:Phosphatidylserine decarboxylase proenzyme 3 [Sphaceloma murrayae]
MALYVRIGMHLLHCGSLPMWVLQSERAKAVLKSQTERLGALYDAPESRKHIRPFVEQFGLANSLHELVRPDLSSYGTFNDFFAREIKQSARPVVDAQDLLVVSSMADCRLVVFPNVSLATTVWIKGFGFSIRELVGDGQLAVDFAGGSLAIHRLAPQDYHRFHSPIDGIIESVVEIPGTYYTVNPQAINQESTLDVFCENRRSVMVVRRTATEARVVIVAVGAMLVGSIKYCADIQPGAVIHRGQCLGWFQYGGSTVIVLFPPDEIIFDADLVDNSVRHRCETKVSVGWRIGRGGEVYSVPRLSSMTTTPSSGQDEVATPQPFVDACQ